MTQVVARHYDMSMLQRIDQWLMKPVGAYWVRAHFVLALALCMPIILAWVIFG